VGFGFKYQIKCPPLVPILYLKGKSAWIRFMVGLAYESKQNRVINIGAEQFRIHCSGFPIGTLPICYLGLPLMSHKLRYSEYAPLLTKITQRMQAWYLKSLLFSGGFQLLF